MSKPTNTLVASEEDVEDCDSLLLMNPNASETEDQSTSPPPPRQLTPSLGISDSKERLANGKHSGGFKHRSKSPSFFKMIVGGFRKTSTDEPSEAAAVSGRMEQRGSFSDTEDMNFSCPENGDDERLRINHFATLPRKDSKRPNNEKMSHITWYSNSYSPEENRETESTSEAVPSDKCSPISPDIMPSSESPLFSVQVEAYHPMGLDALEMLHDQLQLLVRQDCDEEMGDSMYDKVTETLQKQNTDLQRSLECLQSSDQNIRVSLRIAEMRAQEAEIKLHHSNDRCYKLERDSRWLETEFKILYQKYHELQKHLQKKAILHQMSLSPSRQGRRPNLAQTRRQHSFDTLSAPSFSSVKRHNSSEYIHQNNVHQHHHNNHMATSSTLPRLHSGSMSHTETRV